jgi:hypothetical protein
MLKLVHQDSLDISIDVEILPDPRKYANSNKPIPSQREILVKEQILEHEFITNNLNICQMQCVPGMSYTE